MYDCGARFLRAIMSSSCGIYSINVSVAEQIPETDKSN